MLELVEFPVEERPTRDFGETFHRDAEPSAFAAAEDGDGFHTSWVTPAWSKWNGTRRKP